MAFTMWEQQILFKSGWFIYSNGKGKNSLISHIRARELEREFQSYQARMDIDRGGALEDWAYSGRGFTKKNGKYVYENYRVDQMMDRPVAPIEKVLAIPKRIGDISINSVARAAFQGELTIEQVILNDNIQEIEELAFEGCNNLKEIVIPNQYVHIKSDAFKNTALMEHTDTFYINNTLTKVNPSLSGVLQIKDGTTAIADNALQGCNALTEVIFPEGLISIGNSAFDGCTGLQRIALPESLQTMGDYAFSNCSALTEIILPSTMKTIGTAAFNKCTSLTTIALPDGITEIAMFYGCSQLRPMNIPASVNKVWDNSFSDCGFFQDYMNSDKKELYVDNWLIHYKIENRERLHVREGTVGIAGMKGSRPTKLRTLVLPNTIKFIGDSAFNYAAITTVQLPKHLEHIGISAFRGSQLKEIIIPATVKKVEQWAFMDCEQIQTITIEGADTVVVWPAITGRKDKKVIQIMAPKHSKMHEYCVKSAHNYNLEFKPLKAKPRWFTFFHK